MSFCGHEIHVGVDCFSVEPLGLRPRGSLFLPPCFYSPKHGNSNWGLLINLSISLNCCLASPRRATCLGVALAKTEASGIHKPTVVGVKMEGRGKQSLCDCAAPAIEHRLF